MHKSNNSQAQNIFYDIIKKPNEVFKQYFLYKRVFLKLHKVSNFSMRTKVLERWREMCPNMDQKKTPYLDNFHAV